jgi:hypothetical protein
VFEASLNLPGTEGGFLWKREAHLGSEASLPHAANLIACPFILSDGNHLPDMVFALCGPHPVSSGTNLGEAGKPPRSKGHWHSDCLPAIPIFSEGFGYFSSYLRGREELMITIKVPFYPSPILALQDNFPHCSR